MISKTTSFFVLFFFADFSLRRQQESKKVDYMGFLNISQELVGYRDSRLVDVETFNAYAAASNTMTLDTRSKAAYDEIHIKGAVHLNFSDFTEKALAEIIPNKNTCILIYCNNNFISSREALMNKMGPMALNIPTFINLYGYGYTNVYELNAYLNENDDRVEFTTNGKN